MAQLEKHTNSFGKRLSLFLRYRLPSERLYLCHDHHLVRDSLPAHLPKFACLILMSDVHAPNVVNRQECESLLGKRDKFMAFSGSGLEQCDECYFHLYKTRSDIMRSGQTGSGFEKRYKEHKNLFQLQDRATNTNVFTNHILIQQWVGNVVCGVTWNMLLGL
jgi:hypothetical protein